MGSRGTVPAPRVGRGRTAGPALPLSVLTVFDAGEGGEAERVTLAMVRHADPVRFGVQVCAIGAPPPEVSAGVAGLGATLHSCHSGGRFPVDFTRLLRRLRPDVVHVQFGGGAAAALAAARAAGVPRRILHLRGRSRPALPTPAARARRALVDTSATGVLADSEAVMRSGWRPDWHADPRCRVVYQGLEPEPYGVAIAARHRCVEVGRLLTLADRVTLTHIGEPGRQGGRERAVSILAALRDRGVDALLQIVQPRDEGEDPRLAEAAWRRGAGEAVEFLDDRDDLARVLAASSLLLATSQPAGGLPAGVLEARAAGTPVLASTTPGVAEIARLLPGVTMLPPAAPDGVWVDKAALLTASPPSLDDRRESLRRFCRSPFAIDAWAGAIASAWSTDIPR
jgi:glycosyltransferase involved in cell wall biosynthesis